MICKNDYVNYGTHGICRVEDIRPMKFDAWPESRSCYILRPVYDEHSCIFVPADNRKLTKLMRPVLSAEEIDTIILSVKDKNLLWIDDRKKRTARFQDILLKRDEKELLLLAGCLYLKSREAPRGLSSTDAQTLKTAESIINQEFSFSLGISPRNTGAYIRKKLGIPDLQSTPVSG